MASKKIKKTQTPAELPREGFVRLGAVLHAYPIGKSSWLRGVALGIYPKPVKLSKRVSAWDVRQIRELLASFDAD